jgi:hypothetical protein
MELSTYLERQNGSVRLSDLVLEPDEGVILRLG